MSKKSRSAYGDCDDALPVPRQVDLIRRLVSQQHLSVPERQELDGGVASGRLVVDAIAAVIEEHGYYPSHARPRHPYAGGIIEQIGPNETIVHWQAEVGLQRYAVLVTERFGSVRAAAEHFVKREWREGIDGIPVLWPE